MRSTNEAQGNDVNWYAGQTEGTSTVVITTPDGREETLVEGVDYFIGPDEKAYYIGLESP